MNKPNRTQNSRSTMPGTKFNPLCETFHYKDIYLPNLLSQPTPSQKPKESSLNHPKIQYTTRQLQALVLNESATGQQQSCSRIHTGSAASHPQSHQLLTREFSPPYTEALKCSSARPVGVPIKFQVSPAQ